MTAWSDLIKKLVKENPGTPLNIILPIAKKQYKKPFDTMKQPFRSTKRYIKRNRVSRRRQRR